MQTPPPHLREFVGDDGFVNAVLATVERVCLAAATMFVPLAYVAPASTRWLCFDEYRIAAVHDKDRLAARVRQDLAAYEDEGTPRSIADVVESIVLYDVVSYSGLATDSWLETSALRKEVANRSRQRLTLVEQCYLARAKADYDQDFDAGNHITLVQSSRSETVRCGVLFPAIHMAIAEYLANEDPERMFAPGTDIVRDTALANYTSQHKVLAFDRLDTLCRTRESAISAMYLHAMDALAPDTVFDSLYENTVSGWCPSLREPLADDALLTETGAHYLLQRVHELTQSCL